jgi:biopolymer transport protein ExbB/TolQ
VDRRVAVQSISNNLATAFDTTFVGLLCSAIAYLLYTLILRHADYHAKK